MTRTPTTISVDFNRLDDEDVLWAPRALVPNVSPHQYVVLHDADGNRCLGIVRRFDARRIYIYAVLSTWQDANPVVVSWENFALDEALERQVRIVTGKSQLTVGVNTNE